MAGRSRRDAARRRAGAPLILLDTSVWIESFRKRPAVRIEDIADFDEIVTCLPVIQEVLQGFSEESAFRRAREGFWNLPIVENPLSEEVYDESIDLYRIARRNGRTVRSSVDCLVAICAIRNDLEILHRDRDYPALASVSRLRQRAV